jgi:hypothetical protein
MKVWSITADSESCDHYGPFLVMKKPTKKELDLFAHSLDGDEDKEGPGRDGSYVSLEVQEIKVEERLK